MNKLAPTGWKVTKAGGIGVTLMVAAWIAGIAAGQIYPKSWIGEIIGLPLGVSIYCSAITIVFAVIGAASGALGRPFFTKASGA